LWFDEEDLMGAFLHFHVCWMGCQDVRDQIPAHSSDLAADEDIIALESTRLAENETVTG